MDLVVRDNEAEPCSRHRIRVERVAVAVEVLVAWPVFLARSTVGLGLPRGQEHVESYSEPLRPRYYTFSAFFTDLDPSRPYSLTTRREEKKYD